MLADDGEARIIAGGQTLVPMMAMRLARPSRLIDIARLTELRRIEAAHESVVIGAAVRQCEAERDADLALRLPLLALALPCVGHAATRSRGTLGGSLANADPAAEIPLVLTALGGSVIFQSAEGKSTLPAEAFLLGPMMTALPEGAIVSGLSFPTWSGARIGAGFEEISARQSDFAYVSAAAQAALDEDGRCLRCAVAVGAVCAAPVRLRGAARALAGTMLTQAQILDALTPEIDALDIMKDNHASVAYRRRVALTLAARALGGARDKALAKGARP